MCTYIKLRYVSRNIGVAKSKAKSLGNTKLAAESRIVALSTKLPLLPYE